MEIAFRLRLYLLTALILLGCGMLLMRLKEFQINRQKEFIEKVPGTRTITIREPGVRGNITDRNGTVLVDNERNYEVTFNLQEIAKAYRENQLKERTLETLTYEKGMPRKKSETDIVAIVEQSITPKLEKHGLAKSFSKRALRTHYLTYKGHVPFTYRNDLTYEQFATFAEHNLELPGVYVEVRPIRRYSYGALASHILGYIKKWDKGNIPEVAKKEFNLYLGEPQGIAGVEATMNKYLVGPEGKRTLIKDEKGRTIGLADYKKPGTGATVKLTIDAGIQTLAESVLRRAGRAAAVVMDVHTGEILALASVPDYTPSNFIPSISSTKFKEYNSNLASPFTNRAITGLTPGSTFKLATALTGCMHGHDNDQISCTGFVPYGRHKIGCWIYNLHGSSHGVLSLEESIQRSCNPYFNKLSNALGSKNMVDGFEKLGLGMKTGIPLPNEDPGIVPGSEYWKRRIRPGGSMSPALAALMSIGQGDASASPLQMAMLVSSIANNGKLYIPRLIKEVVDPDGKIIISDKSRLRMDLTKNGLKQENIKTIQAGMWKAVNKAGGTAGRAKIDDEAFHVAAKTGTAQTSSRGKKSHNAWTVAFAPYNAPRYAVAVVVQGGKSGGAVAGPLVRSILLGLQSHEKGTPLRSRGMIEYAGHFEAIEEIIFEDDDPLLAQVQNSITTEIINNDAGIDAVQSATPILVRPNIILPNPTITPEADSAPVAVPVTE